MQSEELLNGFLNKLRSESRGGAVEGEHDQVGEILESIASTSDEIKNDPALLYEECLKISNQIDNLTIFSFETFIKGREEVLCLPGRIPQQYRVANKYPRNARLTDGKVRQIIEAFKKENPTSPYEEV